MFEDFLILLSFFLYSCGLIDFFSALCYVFRSIFFLKLFLNTIDLFLMFVVDFCQSPRCWLALCFWFNRLVVVVDALADSWIAGRYQHRLLVFFQKVSQAG